MRPLFIIPALAAFTACVPGGPNHGSQIGSETSGCELVSEEPISDASVAPEGFTMSADEAAQALGLFEGELERSTGDVQPLELELVATGDAVVWRMEAVDDGSGMEMGAYCPDLIVLPATMSLRSGELLDESISLNVLADTDGLVTASAQLDQAEVSGDAAPDLLVPEDLAELWFIVLAERAGEGWAGELSWMGESYPSGSGDDAVVSAANDPYGTFEVLPAE